MFNSFKDCSSTWMFYIHCILYIAYRHCILYTYCISYIAYIRLVLFQHVPFSERPSKDALVLGLTFYLLIFSFSGVSLIIAFQGNHPTSILCSEQGQFINFMLLFDSMISRNIYFAVYQTSTGGEKILHQEDSTCEIEGEWKRINTLGHFLVIMAFFFYFIL